MVVRSPDLCQRGRQSLGQRSSRGHMMVLKSSFEKYGSSAHTIACASMELSCWILFYFAFRFYFCFSKFLISFLHLASCSSIRQIRSYASFRIGISFALSTYSLLIFFYCSSGSSFIVSSLIRSLAGFFPLAFSAAFSSSFFYCFFSKSGSKFRLRLLILKPYMS